MQQERLPTMQLKGGKGRKWEVGQMQDAEECVWSQETKSPGCDFLQTKPD